MTSYGNPQGHRMIDPFDTAASLYITPVIKMSTIRTLDTAPAFVHAARDVIGATDLASVRGVMY